MKIVQVMPRFSMGGAEIMCETLTYELIRLGHSVIVVSLYDYRSVITERLEAAGVDVRYLGKHRGADPFLLNRLRRLLRKEKPDVVHSHLYASEYALPAAAMAGVLRRVHTLHNVAEKENGRMGRFLNRLFFHRLRAVPVALSALVQETVVKEYRLPPASVPVIMNGVALDKCIPKADYAQHGDFTVLHVGRFFPSKNHAGLLRAFSRLLQAYPDCRLLLVGDGETRESAEAYVAENGLGDRVSFLGFQADVHPYLREADVFALPSFYEGVPLTLIEAMASGLPIVASAVGGVPDLLDGQCATLIAPQDDALTEALLRYRESEALRRAHGTVAAEKSTGLSAAAMAARYVEVYTHE